MDNRQLGHDDWIHIGQGVICALLICIVVKFWDNIIGFIIGVLSLALNLF